MSFVLVVLLIVNSNAQSTPADIRAVFETPCLMPSLEAKAVTLTKQTATAYLRFQADANIPYFYREGNGQLQPIVVTNGEIILEGLPLDRIFEVYTENSCYELSVVTSFGTYIDKSDAFEMSEQFYNEIKRFQKQETPISLSDFLLTEIKGVSYYEKTAFLQQFFHNGQPLHQLTLGELPLPITYEKSGDRCDCKLLFTHAEIAEPAEVNAGNIENDYDEQQKIPLQGNPDANVWWNRANKGPSKWHALLTEGGNAGNTTMAHEVEFGGDSSNVGVNYAYLRYNYLCVDYAQVPTECKCAKPLYLYWRYNSRAQAHAETHDYFLGLANKKAFATAQDRGVTTLHKDGTNQVKILDAGEVQAEAVCETTANGEFWGNFAAVALDVALISFGVTDAEVSAGFNLDSFAISMGVTNIAEDIADVATTPLYTMNECNTANNVSTLCKGDTLIYITPNEPITLTQFSFSKLRSGGKRSWFSFGQVVSDFYLLGYVPGGYLANEEEQHCCSQHLANWILASCDFPSNNHHLKEEIGSILAVWLAFPFAETSGWGFGIPSTDFGIMERESGAAECDDLEVETGGLLSDGGIQNLAAAPSQFTTLRVFDIAGRMLLQEDIHTSDELPNFKLWLSQHLGYDLPSGLYIVHTSDGNSRQVYKVMIP